MLKKNIIRKNKENLLVLVDDSAEFLDAMRYACDLATADSLGILLLYILQEEKFRHWKGVESIMREEQKNEGKEVLDKYILFIEKICWSHKWECHK